MRNQVTNSAGFKKRLLRPVSSHQSQKQVKTQLLKNIDLSLTDSALENISTNNLNLFGKYIQSLDIDRSIRNKKFNLTQSSLQLNKNNGIVYLKDWIMKENQTKDNKQNQQTFDVNKTLTKIGCQNAQSGFKKTFKCLQYLDQVMTKSCETVIIQILKYHQTFDSSIPQEEKDSYKLFLEELTLSKMDNGLFLIKLLPIFISRQGKIFSQLIKLNKHKTSSSKSSSFDQKKQATYQQMGQKLKTLIRQNSELKSRDDKIQVQIQKIQRDRQIIQDLKSKSSYFLIEKCNKEMKELYNEQIKQITKQMDAQMSNNIILRTKVKQLQLQNKKHAEQRLKNPIPKFKGADYNEAMMQEFNKMRKGFQKKIEELKTNSLQGEKQLRKQMNKLNKSLQDIQWQKRIILKKYEFLVSCDSR